MRLLMRGVCLLLMQQAVAPVVAAPLVGAYYYPWWGDGIAGGHAIAQTLRAQLTPVPQMPAVGNGYSSRDARVIASHIDQSHQGNIAMWALSWWGPNRFEDLTIRNHILPHPRASELSYTIHYESAGRLGDFNSPDYTNLIPDFRHLADHVFSDPNYLRIDDRPVVILYLSRVFFKDAAGVAALESLRATMQTEYGYDPYLIGDHLFGTVAPNAGALDAITGFDVYGQAFADGNVDENDILRLERNYLVAQHEAEKAGVDFVPAAAPGYNDKAVRPGNEPAARYLPGKDFGSVFQAMLETAVLPHTDADTGDMILVNSFNEWHEDTQIEASVLASATNADSSFSGSDFTRGRFYEGYGTRYLDILRGATRLALAGDFDDSGIVDGADLLIWQRNPGSLSLAEWQENFGAIPKDASAVVPEPAALALLLGGLLGNALLPRRRGPRPSASNSIAKVKPLAAPGLRGGAEGQPAWRYPSDRFRQFRTPRDRTFSKRRTI